MLRKITILLMVLLLMTGCSDKGDSAPADADVPVTEVPAAATETLPSETYPQLTADAIYRKMALTVSNKWVLSYSQSAEVIMESADSSYHMNTTYDVFMNVTPLTIYQESETVADVNSAGMKMNITDKTRIYVGMEGSTHVTYVHGVTYDEWYRYEMEETAGDIMVAYSYFNPVYSTPPEGITVDDEIQIVDDRDAYVLRFTMSGEEALGVYTEGVELEYVYYVDAENFMLLKQETVYYGMDQYIMDTIRGVMGTEDIGDENLFTRMEMRETLTDICFDPVEVPTVPQEGIDNSLDVTDIPYESSGDQYL